MTKKSLTIGWAKRKMRFNFLSKKLFVIALFLCFFAATVMTYHFGRAQTDQFAPDWTAVTHDFFNLSPATSEPVLTPSMVTDRSNVTVVADPFLFNEDDTWYMFFEVNYNNSVLYSDIGLATSSDGLNWTYQQIVLDEPFHLAYPYVFKWDDTYYMIPEAYTENAVKLYEATNFPYNWTFVKNIVTGFTYLDSSVFRYNDTWWLFTSDASYNMFIFYSANLAGPWQSHSMNPVRLADTAAARGGGRVTVFNGSTIIRLAQNYTVSYGREDDAYQVTTLTTTSFNETEIGPLIQASGSGWNADGMHNLDPWWIGNRWLAVVDGVNYNPSEVWSIGIYESPIVKNSLTISTNYGEVSPANGTYDSGSNVTITATPPAAGPGEQYVFLGWTGSGDGSYTGLDNPAVITMNDNINETASWKIQYYLTVSSAHGSPSPSSGWFDSGSNITAFVASPVSGGSGVQYVCAGWSGSGSVPASGSSSALTFTIDAPSTIDWVWTTQYYLTVSSAYGTAGGEGWYDSGASAYATVPLAVAGDTGIQYVFAGWGGDASGTEPRSNPISMDAAHIAVARYKTQYYITVTSAHGDPTPSEWIDAGKDFFVSVASPADTVPNDHRFICTGFSLDNGTYQSGTETTLNSVTEPHSVTFAWKEQLWVAFDETGLPEGTEVNVIVNSKNYSLPYSGWFDKGANIAFAYESQLPNGIARAYVLTSLSAESPITVDAATKITAQYSDQLTAAMTLVIIVPVIVAILIAALLLIRRKRKKQNQ